MNGTHGTGAKVFTQMWDEMTSEFDSLKQKYEKEVAGESR